MLTEIMDVDSDNKADRGWGTFIANKNPLRNLSIQVPYPAENPEIAKEGIQIFKYSNSRSFLIAGAHANASAIKSACQTNASESDVAHTSDAMFHQTQSILNDFHQSDSNFSAIQLHDLADSLCNNVDVYMTYGTNQVPSSENIITTLQTNMTLQNPTWQIILPGDATSCTEHGDKNVQGRFLNGITAPCSQAASNYTERFIYITQKNGHKNADDWINAINTAWPSISAIHTFDLSLTKGWNLISIPIDTDEAATELFDSNMIGKAWHYNGELYAIATSLEPKKGYWIYSKNDASVSISGAEITNANIELKSGWSLSGPSAQPPFTGTAVSLNEILVATNSLQPIVWHFDASLFRTSTSFTLGKGYWVFGY